MYDDVNKINKRGLDDYYVGLYFYRYTFTLSTDNDVKNLEVYFIVGCDVSSHRKLLLVKKCYENNTRFYLEALQQLKSRGINNIVFCQLEDLPISRKSQKIVYPKAVLIPPIELPLNAIKQYCDSSYKGGVENKYINLYLHDINVNIETDEFVNIEVDDLSVLFCSF